MQNENVKQTLENTSDKISKVNYHVAPSPHIFDKSFTTRKMMLDVLLALIPVVIASYLVFKSYILNQILISIAGCLLSEYLFNKMRGYKANLTDLSCVVTAIILALSLPWSSPWYVTLVASITAIGFGKVVFGGLGQNIFNPAMVGRAFVMICFPVSLGAGAFVAANSDILAISQATPLTIYKQSGTLTVLKDLFIGNVNGSLGETSALACLIGGAYLCIKRTASWEIPASILLSVSLFSIIHQILMPSVQFGILHHLLSGALMFGAFFIATDPVTSPLTPKGKFIFGFLLGFLIMVIRIFSGYPEGFMFALLLMNAITPLINRLTIPKPVGGLGRVRK
ncbi:MAG: hypothetical protein ACD_79C00952G0003 [uncultured bacterium]|nr:MAG: hypothetical protein ACD_79C00952G0003 [uncultured bacterium]